MGILIGILQIIYIIFNLIVLGLGLFWLIGFGSDCLNFDIFYAIRAYFGKVGVLFLSLLLVLLCIPAISIIAIIVALIILGSTYID